MSYSIPVVFQHGELSYEDLNECFASLQNEINSLRAQIAAVEDPTPVNLSGYVTTAQLQSHIDAANAHSGMMIWKTATAVNGTDLPANKAVKVYRETISTDGSGTVTHSWTNPFTGGILGAHATLLDGTAAAISETTLTKTAITLKGPNSKQLLVTAYGWDL